MATENTNSSPAVNEDALNANNLTTDVQKTEGNLEDKIEIGDTGTGQMVDGKEDTEGESITVPSTVPTPEELIATDIEDTKKTQEGLADKIEERQLEDDKIKEENIATAQENAAAQNQIIQNKSEKLESINERQRQLSQEQTDFATRGLEEQRNLAMQKEKLAFEEQKIENRQALEKAKTDLNINRQRASWRLNKLGVAFSSGAVLDVQAIADRGALEIAKLQITSKKLEVDTQANIAKLDFEYASDINKLIGDNITNQLTLDKETANQIADTQNSVLLTETAKAEAIRKIEEDYLTKTRANEDKLSTEQSALTDKMILRTKELQSIVTQKENEEKERINTSISSGSWYGKTTAEKRAMAEKAGMSVSELDLMADNQISEKAYALSSSIMGDDFLLSQGENEAITSTVKRLLNSGVGMEQATQRAVANVLKGNSEYQKQKQLKELETKVTEKKMKEALTDSGYYGTATSTYTPKASDIIQKVTADGKILNYNEVTKEQWYIEEPTGFKAGTGPITSLIQETTPIKFQQSESQRINEETSGDGFDY